MMLSAHLWFFGLEPTTFSAKPANAVPTETIFRGSSALTPKSISLLHVLSRSTPDHGGLHPIDLPSEL